MIAKKSLLNPAGHPFPLYVGSDTLHKPSGITVTHPCVGTTPPPGAGVKLLDLESLLSPLLMNCPRSRSSSCRRRYRALARTASEMPTHVPISKTATSPASTTMAMKIRCGSGPYISSAGFPRMLAPLLATAAGACRGLPENAGRPSRIIAPSMYTVGLYGTPRCSRFARNVYPGGVNAAWSLLVVAARLDVPIR